MFQVPTILNKPRELNEIEVRRIVYAIDVILNSSFSNPPQDLITKVTEFAVKVRPTLLRSIGEACMFIVDRENRLRAWKTFIRSLIYATFALNNWQSTREPSFSISRILHTLLKPNRLDYFDKDHEMVSSF